MSGAEVPDGQFYVTGGTMDPESASYVTRSADTELLDALRNGELCHVLASRQMGKSSLMASTARRIARDGMQCSLVDLTIFSEKSGAPDDWYYALVENIADKLGLQFDIGDWWGENSRLPSLGRMTRFLDKVVLTGCPGQVVIFLDEIDSTIPLPFSDEFFAAIRACYNARAVDARFKRLNFVLLGVATPAQLIRDPARTPFNVGRSVELTDFSPTEAAPLAAGLHTDSTRAADLLGRVLHWTDGHPYLTQTLCWYLVRNSTWEMDELVKDIFLSRRAAREEPNLRLVRERLTQGAADLASVLTVYREIVEGQSVRDEPNSPVHASLRLSGVVKTDVTGDLKVRNRIYKKVFSAEWVASEMPTEPPTAPRVPPEMCDAYVTYDTLRKLAEFRPLAAGVLARFCESRGLRDEALLVRIRALSENPSVVNRCQVEKLINNDYPNLVMSFVHRTQSPPPR
jgi:AAA-like domain